ncbi:MAG: ferric reductase-like transmembrane domain-containing protein [Anaerolineae bacterium]|nr:ferric reductase-like transmembrane domain-containing protein [Anaerolineae bacterium]MCB0178024.1 ferric reductase-like transmembrane domain-containing protein [Anaerolineae bacterium]MCB0222684.1 ferric reductase-like transmembrane domain-containing protein [Anaerolineae bacterium]MCB9107035.1 ferric reductase-like transmembrane domain-containing protein [Anaerolineales bacterium]
MTTLSKLSNQTSGKTLLNIMSIALGVMVGGIVSLALLWLWLQFQAGPAQSYLGAASAYLWQLVPAGWQLAALDQAQLMGLPLTGETPAFWYMARIGGIIAYLLLWLSVVWGLVMSTKISKRITPQLVYGLHEFLALLALGFMALHSFVLLGDSYFDFTIFSLAIPFTAPYEPLWTGVGTITFYLSLVLTASFYVRKRIGHKIWRALHYVTFLAYALALGHGLMAGSDSDTSVMTFVYLLTGLSVLFLTYFRLFTLKSKSNRKEARRPINI